MAWLAGRDRAIHASWIHACLRLNSHDGTGDAIHLGHLHAQDVTAVAENVPPRRLDSPDFPCIQSTFDFLFPKMISFFFMKKGESRRFQVSGRFQVHTVGWGSPGNLSPERLVGAEGGTRTPTGFTPTALYPFFTLKKWVVCTGFAVHEVSGEIPSFSQSNTWVQSNRGLRPPSP